MPFMQKFLELKLSTCLISIHASLITHGGSMDGRTVTGVPGGLLFACLVFESGPHNVSQDGSELSNLLLSLGNAGIAGLHQYAPAMGKVVQSAEHRHQRPWGGLPSPWVLHLNAED